MTSGGCFFLLNFGWRRFIKGFLTTNHLFNASPSLLGVTVLLKFSRRQEKTGLGHPDRRVISSETSADLVLIDSWPIGSMHGIYANIGGILMVNVTIYSIHGSYDQNTRTCVSFCIDVSMIFHDFPRKVRISMWRRYMKILRFGMDDVSGKTRKTVCTSRCRDAYTIECVFKCFQVVKHVIYINHAGSSVGVSGCEVLLSWTGEHGSSLWHA